MQDIQKLARIQILTIFLFIICKLWLRPFILDGDFHVLFDIAVLSLPNFFEGIIGVLALTYIGLYINYHIIKHRKKISNNQIYTIATILSAVFVLTQEFKIHNLGGNNVYDPYDVAFSIIGLAFGYLIIYRFKPNIQEQN